MSDVLARIRVRETHGIRRFLYPLSAFGAVPESAAYSLLGADGQPVPLQIATARIDFAVSLAPFETAELTLVGAPIPFTLSDPLRLAETEGGLQNRQQRFEIEVRPDGGISGVVYDGIRHLRSPGTITCNGQAPTYKTGETEAAGILTGRVSAQGRYPGGGRAHTTTVLTACKSWSTITHQLEQPQADDEIVFTLPFAATSSPLTCDFGIGGYLFGKLDASTAPEIVWRTEFSDTPPYARWTLETAGRTDYVGTAETAEAFASQRWFHEIDRDKALAAAITEVPKGCCGMTIRLTHTGSISVAFRLGEPANGPVQCGVCWHFLNDIPALAAATNPQSLLLPPVVEVDGLAENEDFL